MSKVYLVGAKLKSKILNNWELYEQGIILELDVINKSIKHKVSYFSPSDVCPSVNPSISFTAATLFEKKLYVGTHTEVLAYNNRFEIENYFSLPMFNDIHHVKPRENGNLLVVNTGLDMVVEVTKSGEVVRYWNVAGESPWDRFSETIDYRKIPSTKPHKSHPNFVFELEGDIWVTRCLQKDAICLNDPKKKISIGRELIHDGVRLLDKIYFTQVDGRIVIVDVNSLRVEKEIDLVKITPGNQKIGWCRGIMPLKNNMVLVGFSRVRPSREVMPDGTVKWKGQYGHSPTRLACYDLSCHKLIWELNLEKFNMNAIYSIN